MLDKYLPQPDRPTATQTSIGESLCIFLMSSLRAKNQREVRQWLENIQSNIHRDYMPNQDIPPIKEEEIQALLNHEPVIINVMSGSLEDRFRIQWNQEGSLLLEMCGSNPNYGQKARENFERLFDLSSEPEKLNEIGTIDPPRITITSSPHDN